MTETALATSRPSEAIEQVLVGGNLAALSTSQRIEYYRRVCESLGLNPLTRPFDYINLSGKLTLYARKDATEQLRRLRRVSVRIVSRELVEDVYIVVAQATDRDGRTDESIGAVPLAGLKGEARANAIMKAETKAKRRVTLSICGLGVLDETEVDSIPGAQVVAAEVPDLPAPVVVAAPVVELEDDDGPEAEEATTELVACYRWGRDPEGGKGTQAKGEWVASGEQPKASPSQLAKIHILLKQASVDEAGYRQRLTQLYGKSSAAQVSRDEASDLIERLQKKLEVDAARAVRQQERLERVRADVDSLVQEDMSAIAAAKEVQT